MLPPRLKEIKDQLERKGYAKRAVEEDELLVELTILDTNAQIQKTIMTEEKLSASRILSGPRNSCNCCGRPL